MLPVSCVDLFSGIGGNAYAFRSFAKTVAYCEINKNAVSILKSVMKRGLVCEAEIHPDVRTLPIMPCDMISASWPCQGNSPLGKRKGMEDERSALVQEVARLLEGKPKIVFLENVPLVLNNGSFEYVLGVLAKHGYRVAWGIVSANNCGFPHERKRFFCVATLDPLLLRSCMQASRATSLEPYTEYVRRMKVYKDEEEAMLNTRRLQALGNSVVPAASKLAFETLSCIVINKSKFGAKVVKSGAKKYPTWGYYSGTYMYAVQKPIFPVPVFPKLTFWSGFFPSTGVQMKNILPILTEKVTKSMWSTPRHGNTGASLAFTARALTDLGSQLRFEKDTPNRDRAGSTMAEFVEAMMGYPIDYTSQGIVN